MGLIAKYLKTRRVAPLKYYEKFIESFVCLQSYQILALLPYYLPACSRMNHMSHNDQRDICNQTAFLANYT
jgi:hypothetical protein